jgi:hypothetical protein
LLNLVGSQISQGSIFNLNLSNFLNFNVSSVILNIYFEGYIGTVGSISAEVNAQCGVNTYKVGKWNQSVYSSSNSLIDMHQIILPVINDQIIFSAPIWYFGESLKIELVGYYF